MSEDNLARRARHGTGLSQRDFAKLIRANYVTVAKWETGEHPPAPVTASLLRLIEAEPARSVEILRRAQAEDEAEFNALAKKLKRTTRGADDVRALGARSKRRGKPGSRGK